MVLSVSFKNPIQPYVNSFPRLGGHRFDVLQSDFRDRWRGTFNSLNMDKKNDYDWRKCCDWKTALYYR